MWELVNHLPSHPSGRLATSHGKSFGSFGHACVGRWGSWTARNEPF